MAKSQPFFISLIIDGRAYPLHWQILGKEGASNLREQEALVAPVLDWFAHHLPVKIVLLGDREFHSVDFAQWLASQGIDYVLREKKDLQVKQKDGLYHRLDAWSIRPGTKLFITPVTIVKSKGFGEGNLAIYWKRPYRGKGEKEAWYLLTNLTDIDEVLQCYRRRMGIEAMFKDGKTGGYYLEDCKASPRRLNALILVMAIAYTLSSLQGKGIKKCRQEKYVGRCRSFRQKRTKNSHFKLGLYGQLFCRLPVELMELGQALMKMTPSKRLFYWRGERARSKIEQAF